jgi:uncharacterized Zn-finger protein
MVSVDELVVETRKVFCEGNSKNNEPGHPGIYLVIPNNSNSVVCPYCSKKFVLKTEND